MKWIILASSRQQLAGLLESAEQYGRTSLANVVGPDQQQDCWNLQDAYNVQWWPAQPFRNVMLEILERPNVQRGSGAATLITPDTMRFRARYNTYPAVTALQNPNDLLAVSLVLGSDPTTMEVQRQFARGSEWHQWRWYGLPASHGLTFTWGMIYRTFDLVDAIAHSQFQTPAGMRAAIGAYAPLRRRPWIAHPPELPLTGEP